LYKIKLIYPKEFEVAMQAKKIIEKYLNASIPEDEAGFITIFLISDKEYISKQCGKVKVIIIAHGNSTATSMADVANKLLGENYAIGIDAHLDKSPLEVLETLKNYVKSDMNQAGYLLLVDMGSLTTFGETIEKEFNVPVKVIPLISTLHVIEATRKALLGMPLNNIYMSVQAINSYMENNMDFAPLISGKKKIAIITACLTGEGASVAIKSFLKNNLKFDKEIFEIIPIDSLDKHMTMKKIEEIQENMEIAFIVSSFPIDTNIKQYSMNDVLSLKVIKELQEIVDIKTTLLKMGYVLKENIDNIDGEELYSDIQSTIMRLCDTLSVCFDDDMLLGIILHFAFMVSRIKKGEKSIEFLGKEEYIKNNKSLYNAVKQSLNYLNTKYSIKIPDDEICYIMRFFQEKDALFNII
jgi:transcriptional regulatory protein LevR